MNRNDGWMFQSCQNSRFTHHSWRKVRAGFRKAQDFQGHLALELSVLRQENSSHTSRADGIDASILRVRQIGRFGNFLEMVERLGRKLFHRRSMPKSARASYRNS